MWVEFFVGSLLCYERFFSGYSGFPLSSTFPNSNHCIQISVDEYPLCGGTTANSYSILSSSKDHFFSLLPEWIHTKIYKNLITGNDISLPVSILSCEVQWSCICTVALIRSKSLISGKTYISLIPHNWNS